MGSFTIKAPFVVASHIPKLASPTLTDRSKSAPLAIDTADGFSLKYSGGGTIRTVHTGSLAPIGSAASNAGVLTAAQAGRTFLFDVATTFAYTLPAPVVGLTFEFLWTALETGGQVHNIITKAGTQFLLGTVFTFSGADVTPSNLVGPKSFAGNGTSHVQVSHNGTTSGGGIGTRYYFRALSATQWYVSGLVNSPSGTIVTPFA